MPAARKRVQQEAEVAVKKPKVDPMVGAIIEAIEMANDLPPSCKGMLSAMVPEAFPVPASERHPHQKVLVDIVGGVISSIDEGLKKDVDNAHRDIEVMEKKRSQLQDNVDAAKTVCDEKKQLVEARKTELAQHFRQMLDNRMALASAKEARAFLDAPLADLQGQKARCENALQGLAVLRETADPERVNEIREKLLEVALEIKVEETLAVSLPTVCEKPPAERSPFDTLVLNSIGAEIEKKREEVTKILDGKAAEVQQLDAAVTVAQTALDKTTTKHVAAAEAVTRVLKEEKASMEMLGEQQKALNKFVAELEKAETSVQERKTSLDNFKTWNMDCYNVLKDKVVVAKQPPAASEHIEKPVADAGSTIAESAAAEPVAAAEVNKEQAIQE